LPTANEQTDLESPVQDSFRWISSCTGRIQFGKKKMSSDKLGHYKPKSRFPTQSTPRGPARQRRFTPVRRSPKNEHD
jgi:hypothetical protein